MGRLSGLCAFVTAAALATSAAAASPPGTFNFAFPLPKLGHGSIYEVVLKIHLPAGTTVTGTPFVFHLANGSTTPGYIRAADKTFAEGSGTWDIFVGINAPTSTKGVRLPSSAAAATLRTTLQVNPIPGATSAATEPSKEDACDRLKAARGAAIAAVLLGFSQAEADEIFNYILKDDSDC